MKKISIILLFLSSAFYVKAQGFDEAIKTAKSSYTSGKLEDAHFALLQAMQEVDMIIGKEVLKLLPAKMENREANMAQDNVSSNVGLVGSTIHRNYGADSLRADLSIISNSPLVATLNTFLNAPMLGGLMNDANNKTIKVQGYKGRLSASEGMAGKKDFDLQIPLGSALVTFHVNGCTESQMIAMANTLPMQQIAKLIQ